MERLLLNTFTRRVKGKTREIAIVECPDCDGIREMRYDSYVIATTTCCRSCLNLRRPTKNEEDRFDWEAYYHSKLGKAAHIYQTQRLRCKTKGWPEPDYTREELIDWLLNSSTYHALFDAWEASGHQKHLAPSVDRLDDYKTYSLANTRIVTWQENNNRGRKDQVEGRNLKNCKAVDQLTLDGVFVQRFHSVSAAARFHQTDDSKIGAVCRGLPVKKGNKYVTPKTVKGFKWQYSAFPNREDNVT